ncbi:hypothetical protein BKA58DRAFT_218569 [Alternaria rosae]|uniref:uncharacterized protein n=1 Tax=Alternaria rosae TaxID=1187941 RepID=UPI001E8CBBEF|nr:uncharacterized protein BKA58DRAFT_218569 [Alternaria rosae]KAH6867106.1 hypothetical protein BKA58DRAFT_218569 [Alternaria rosae]
MVNSDLYADDRDEPIDGPEAYPKETREEYNALMDHARHLPYDKTQLSLNYFLHENAKLSRELEQHRQLDQLTSAQREQRKVLRESLKRAKKMHQKRPASGGAEEALRTKKMSPPPEEPLERPQRTPTSEQTRAGLQTPVRTGRGPRTLSIRSARDSSAGTGLDASHNIAPDNDDTTMPASPSALSAIEEVNTPRAASHAFGEGMDLGFEPSVNPNLQQGDTMGGTGVPTPVFPARRSSMALGIDNSLITSGAATNISQTSAHATSDVVPQDPGSRENLPPRKRGRAKAKKEAPPPTPALDFFVLSEDGTRWRDPMYLNEDIRVVMSNQIKGMVEGNSKDQYQKAVQRGEAEINHESHSCFNCQVTKRSRNLCHNDSATETSCSRCCEQNNQPCGKLIKHPGKDDAYAIGYLPVPANLRGYVFWEDMHNWVPVVPNKRAPRDPSPAKTAAMAATDEVKKRSSMRTIKESAKNASDKLRKGLRM